MAVNKQPRTTNRGRPVTSQLSTVDEFCRRNRMSRATFYYLLRRGLGPEVLKVGSMTRVSEEAERAWRRQGCAVLAGGGRLARRRELSGG